MRNAFATLNNPYDKPNQFILTRENNLRNKVNANPSIVTILSVFVNITLTHDPVSFVVLLNFVLINDIYSTTNHQIGMIDKYLLGIVINQKKNIYIFPMASAIVSSKIKMLVPAGNARPTPPIGPILGQRGLKAIDFCKQFNEFTKKYEVDTPIPTILTMQPDRKFTFSCNMPPTTWLLKRAAKIDKGAAKPKHEIADPFVKVLLLLVVVLELKLYHNYLKEENLN
ncbi:ribosomal protein L11 [Rhizophagus irregularis DAOM 181602=DAOM 197198]|nr:ribosomal protein L11 [Rhizophagus irregularis DAOM 181602=DAOM 197198]